MNRRNTCYPSLWWISILSMSALVAGCDMTSTQPADDKNEKNDKKAEGSYITFLSHRTGRNLLYRMRSDGSEVTPIFGGELKDVPGLGHDLTLYREPHWSRQSPNRKFFLSWAADLGYPLEKYQSPARFMIYLGQLSGGQVRVIAPDGEEVFAWSPDSGRFAYAIQTVKSPHSPPGITGKSPSTQIVIVGVDGSNEDVVLERCGNWHVMDWSPDGKKLLLYFQPALTLQYGKSDLIEFDLIAAKDLQKQAPPGTSWPSNSALDRVMTPLTGGDSASFIDGRYSPNGKQIATVLERHTQKPGADFDPNNFELAVIDVLTGKVQSVAKYKGGLRGPICWSPDGKEILFSRYLEADDQREKMEGGLGIWAIHPDGTGARLLTTGWSPDWR
jgi:Tol biopolymer transport system component